MNTTTKKIITTSTLTVLLSFGLITSSSADENRPAPDLDPCKTENQTIADLDYSVYLKSNRILTLRNRVDRKQATIDRLRKQLHNSR